MKCGRYRRFIMLNRQGELSVDEARALADHLAGCADCSALLKQAQEADRFMQRIRDVSPVLERPDELVDSVLRRIQAMNAPARKGTGDSVFAGMLDTVLSPAIRFGSIALAAVVVLGFTLQSLVTMKSVSALEGRFEMRGGRPRGPEVAYRVNTEAVGKDPSLRPLTRLLSTEFNVRVNGSLLIARSVIAQFTEGPTPGPLETAQIASVLGRDPARARAVLDELEQHTTTVVLF